MTLPSSGPISLSQVQSEFGGSNPISLSEYYRNGIYVTDNNTGVPTSGTISMSNLRGTQRLVGKDIITSVAALAGTYVSKHPLDYTGGMLYWSDLQTFNNNPIQVPHSEGNPEVFRAGDTNDSKFTAQAYATGLGFNRTTAIAWQHSRVTTVPQNPKINGSTSVTINRREHYATTATSNSGKVYYHSYACFSRSTTLSSGTYASVDFQTGGSVQKSQDKGGILLLPGDWNKYSIGSGLSGSGSFSIPGNMICLLICTGNTDSSASLNLMGLGTNSNLAFLLNYKSHWYDNIQVAIIGNKTETSQSISYSINGDAIVAPKPVFFNLI
jgi:hypothetical protein